MVLHPETQSRAQTEIDDVVGAGRLPNFDDEMSLPYVSALVEEVMRWHPVVPAGAHYHVSFFINLLFTTSLTAIPHRLIVADVYEGYYLPAGSIVIGNTW